VLHICKDRIRLDLYADYPSHAVNWAVTKHNLSIKEARLLFNRPIIGGMDDRGIIVNGTAEEIQDTVNDVIASAGRDSFILGADCTFPTSVNVQNIRVAVDAAARFEDIKSKRKREHKHAQ
jgi:uroporphyrinogen decarboxylase